MSPMDTSRQGLWRDIHPGFASAGAEAATIRTDSLKLAVSVVRRNFGSFISSQVCLMSIPP
eukprot:CAMPEP_0181491204 /NCGR_PEP_ID=MMETSP1110-20121109/49986_1 /TAXON_ID=174948 /ORGANISM="Symbiodinium sp., Strain CCMP421" /LENGTH=60 /DNA_ID=CAMNT_0023618279 /DNA_START=156 /DNA_END=335 /DNA_ORIENTATION=-